MSKDRRKLIVLKNVKEAVFILEEGEEFTPSLAAFHGYDSQPDASLEAYWVDGEPTFINIGFDAKIYKSSNTSLVSPMEMVKIKNDLR